MPNPVEKILQRAKFRGSALPLGVRRGGSQADSLTRGLISLEGIDHFRQQVEALATLRDDVLFVSQLEIMDRHPNTWRFGSRWRKPMKAIGRMSALLSQFDNGNPFRLDGGFCSPMVHLLVATRLAEYQESIVSFGACA
jgi:hypothetical protein